MERSDCTKLVREGKLNGTEILHAPVEELKTYNRRLLFPLRLWCVLDNMTLLC
eukprot:jgi/Botrbrau1/2204/Bobra.101_2s0034.1